MVMIHSSLRPCLNECVILVKAVLATPASSLEEQRWERQHKKCRGDARTYVERTNCTVLHITRSTVYYALASFQPGSYSRTYLQSFFFVKIELTFRLRP